MYDEAEAKKRQKYTEHTKKVSIGEKLINLFIPLIT